MYKKTLLGLVLAFCTAALPAPSAAKKRSQSEESTGTITAVLWRAPGDAGSRSLFYGPGGKEHEPRGPFTFVKEDPKGFNPKFVVRDREGVRWTVKLGPEARPETAASRLIWAIGYFSSEDYLLPDLRVERLPGKLKRGWKLLGADGAFHDVRLKRSEKDSMNKIGNWSWHHGLFSGTRELNGLRALMALINNWDLKDENNAVYDTGTERIYMVSDVGTSFGTTGRSFFEGSEKGNLRSYSRSKFITKVTADYVDFSVPSRPNLLTFYDLRYFVEAMRMRWIGRRVPRGDAKWLGQQLERLSPAQIRAAFRAAGYAPPDVDGFAQMVERRIAALKDL